MPEPAPDPASDLPLTPARVRGIDPAGRRIAAIDCGTNTIKLLILEVAPDTGGAAPDQARDPVRGRARGVVTIAREARMIRLGQDLDRTGRIADAALERAFAAVEEYAALIQQHQVSRIRFCATSATRDASNAADFTAGVRSRLGVLPEVLSGAEEARLAFAGATGGLRGAADEPILVVDIGGGSTELVLGTIAEGPVQGHSMDIGSVRLHERHLHHDPATPAEIAACLADIDAHLLACPVDPGSARTVIGIAGTITTAAAGVLGLARYDRDLIDQAVLGTDRVLGLIEELVASSSEQRRRLGYMHPGRADVIDAGLLILGQVLRHSGRSELVVSESDILDGIAASMLPE